MHLKGSGNSYHDSFAAVAAWQVNIKRPIRRPFLHKVVVVNTSTGAAAKFEGQVRASIFMDIPPRPRPLMLYGAIHKGRPDREGGG